MLPSGVLVTEPHVATAMIASVMNERGRSFEAKIGFIVSSYARRTSAATSLAPADVRDVGDVGRRRPAGARAAVVAV
jgi:hypothetical protein